MTHVSKIKEHMDVISSDRKMVGKVDHLDGTDKIKLTKQSSPGGEHHHFIPLSWVDHVDQHVHLNKTGADVTAHWQHAQS
ncbi:hypothetical protein ABH973_002349 [Bradyrhizobium ottawaense]|uniref:DUF2171 domain-containing protein n=1 Tax=Bradyrhizobium ottawaense TaxID=931866 RepID=UPI001BACE4B6|nr:DUF2171 domain-containing protein [Bradyrhizobium diazoefficiens]MBR0925152.1 DUF2171 domain-containing protein [Bradyrhizobium diazoefficiens]